MSTVTEPILPGNTIGILGSGQLGRMLAMAAKQMGYRVAVFSPEADSPAGSVADLEVVAPYDDLEALIAFAKQTSVVTLEFENIPVEALYAIESHVPLRPGPNVLHIAQNRLREKTFLQDHGFPVVPFCPVNSLADLHQGLTQLGYPAVLKTAGFGYDGKGQVVIRTPEEVEAAYQSFSGQAAILEAFVRYEMEFSVIAARSVTGQWEAFDLFENIHHRHILDYTIYPARVAPLIATEAMAISQQLMSDLEMIGLLCIEFFLTETNTVLINEIAPRPHNSGHVTLDASMTSQFEQQIRAICGLSLGSTDFWMPAAMANLLGDLWNSAEPDWQAALQFPHLKLHLYGKREARPGRKMGHLTALADNQQEAWETVTQARMALQKMGSFPI